MGIYRQLLTENVDYNNDNLFMEMTFTDPKIDRQFSLTRSQLMNLVEFYKDYNVNEYVLNEALANKKKFLSLDDLRVKLGIETKPFEKFIKNKMLPVFKDYLKYGIYDDNKLKAESFSINIKSFGKMLKWIDYAGLKFKIFGDQEVDMTDFTKSVYMTFIVAGVNTMVYFVLIPLLGPLGSEIILDIIAAPYIEEFAKQIAADQGFGNTFVKVFNFIESGMLYVPRMLSNGVSLPIAIGVRMGPIAMHEINQIVHNMSKDPEVMKALNLTNSKEDQERLQYIAQFLTVSIHRMWNIFAVIISLAGK